MDETVVVSYSPKYKAYQKRIHEQQIAGAIKMIEQPGKKRKGKNQNDSARFIKTTNVTEDGEIKENFRIMKTDLEARPVHVRRENRIKAHFLICYTSVCSCIACSIKNQECPYL